VSFSPSPLTLTLYYKAGFANVIDSHEVVLEYTGKTHATLIEEDLHRRHVPPPSAPVARAQGQR
jgi:hypothetical protein